jgi:hypothetical protein
MYTLGGFSPDKLTHAGERLDLEHAKALLCTSASGIHEFGSDPGAANVVKVLLPVCEGLWRVMISVQI